jgi:hypothetical protein
MAIAINRQRTTISAVAAGTKILNSPGSGNVIRIMPGMITIRNTGAATNNIILQTVDGVATTTEIERFDLAAEETWFNEWELVMYDTVDELQATTDNASATDFIVNYIKET